MFLDVYAPYINLFNHYAHKNIRTHYTIVFFYTAKHKVSNNIMYNCYIILVIANLCHTDLEDNFIKTKNAGYICFNNSFVPILDINTLCLDLLVIFW